MMKKLFVLFACACLVGCGSQNHTDELAKKDQELKRMQKDWVTLQSETSSRIAELEDALAQAEVQLVQEFDQHEKLIQLLRNQVDDLREENRQLLLEQAQAPTEEPAEDDESAAEPFEQLEAAANIAEIPKPSFPVRVTDVSGQKVITGSHTVKEFVPSGETFKDKFGRIREDGEWVDKEVNQYGYEVVFSLKNETDQTIQLTARAGLSSESMTLAPDETRIDAKLTAAKGSGLWLLSDGKSIKVDVEYTD